MTKEFDNQINDNEEVLELDDFCEECKKEDPSVSQNLILTGFKTCNSCKLSKTIFPIQLILLIGKAFILLMTKDIERKAIIKKAKKTIPKDLTLDLKFKICFVEIIKLANIQN